jgi:hypothetical protein
MTNEHVMTADEWKAAYEQLLTQAQELERRYQALLQDKTLEKIVTIRHFIENKDMYDEDIIKLVNWHLKKLLAKPKQ